MLQPALSAARWLKRQFIPPAPVPVPMSVAPPPTYADWFVRTFGLDVPEPTHMPFTTFKPGTECFAEVWAGMQRGEEIFAAQLLAELDAHDVEGDVVEFGVYQGHWLAVLAKLTKRAIYGFDSFEGLPEPIEGVDPVEFKRGDFACDEAAVRGHLDSKGAHNVRLVKGWFNEVLPRTHEPGKVAYARIDCDLYESTTPCLDWLTPRLQDGAIVVFDDWQFSYDWGETRAFKEWSERHPELRFEFLNFNLYARLYLRVRRAPAAVD